jgi:hypothetical protein
MNTFGVRTTSATGTGWEPTPWHATQRAAWEALRYASVDVLNHRSESKDRLLACLARSPKCRSTAHGTEESWGSDGVHRRALVGSSQ